ncbi:hypothetical protein WL40_22470 [Burkholderia ubonensis]|uniref:Fimbrial-type adhesion domain-containing protein n=1 Tax=Burkholderia ubonensis TaxID=101571 RepID=A0ABD4DUS2_9BURK|nr:fimbrial protein [Burkholderia ubonensis]KVM03223.1 hypothetical protein WJ51_33340 [Burkholderia ubonensis]KVM20997.1 hypothetical protein WJ52_04705 [Burkholderia ubonensis]KVM45447.1 hypothetical protein WJ56_24935 [Burkholderia ubonensis]KVN76111.1 hypothetical protein WJ68_26145 [Burkholderia ubonensis]KVP67673.1 hypothetical protein WJ92_00055 [Burkholderia ubonensis]
MHAITTFKFKRVAHIAFGLAFLAFGLCTNVQATCNVRQSFVGSGPGRFTISLPATVAFDPMQPDGTVLMSRDVVSQGFEVYATGCKNPNSLGREMHSGVGTLGRFDTFPTSVAGVGIRVGYRSSGGTAIWWNNNIVDNSGSVGMTIYPPPLVVELIKTGPITAQGSLGGEIGRLTLLDHGQIVYSVFMTGTLTIKPSVPTCNVLTKTVPVGLGKVTMETLRGLGSSSQSTPFDIKLQCAGGTQGATTRMFMTLTDAADPGNRGTALSLSPDSKAKGYGIQILRADDTPVSYGPDSAAAGNPGQWYVGEPGNNHVAIPLKARYVRTATDVQPGTANGVATFTMSYQ